MPNYLDRYPRCADCPRLTAWQNSSDNIARKLEEVTIDSSLERVNDSHLLEQKRLAIDEKYAEILDCAEQGDIQEESLEKARTIYESIEESDKKALKKEEKKQKLFSSAEILINSINEYEVHLLAGECKGPRQISLFGLHAKAKCRSRMRRLVINPMPPLPK